MKEPIAIVGMGCQFAGSRNLLEFWRTSRDCRVRLGGLPSDRWSPDSFVSDNPRSPGHTYARRFGRIDDVQSFAAAYFGIAPVRARRMDPQQRLFLEVARCAIEDAGYSPRDPALVNTGVFLGISTCEYRDQVTAGLRLTQMCSGDFGTAFESAPLASLVENVPPVRASTITGQMLNMAAANIAEVFDFHGPNFAVDAACSSAMVAVNEAILHLRAGTCDRALVGGSYVNVTPDNFVCFSRIGALSPSDECRPFDRKADGFVLGEGVGALVLRRLDDALADSDSIWAVIRGSGSSNDGAAGGVLSPSRQGQVEAMTAAYRDAGVSTSTVGLIEAHGTGTAVGDRVEAEALLEAFDAGGAPCRVSSVKANIGHPLAAAGAAGLIRASLAIAFRCAPGQAALDAPASIGFEGSRFALSPESSPLEAQDDIPLRAGVNAFGFGGTNVHVVLEEAPIDARRRLHFASPRSDSNSQPFVVGAPTGGLLAEHLTDISAVLEDLANTPLPDIAYTLSKREADEVRVGFEARTRAELELRLESARALLRRAPILDPHIEWIEPDAPIQFVAVPQARLCPLPPTRLETSPYWILAQPEGIGATPAPGISITELSEAIVETLAQPDLKLTRTTRLGADVGLDSLAVTELFAELESRFPAMNAAPDSLFAGDPTLEELVEMIAQQAPGEGESEETLEAKLAAPGDIDTDIGSFPEVLALKGRLRAGRDHGLRNPYLQAYERASNETVLIHGREYLNFSSYNYLGLSGDPAVSRAAAEAIERHGTSVSASRVASGESPLHRELELAIADMLGCEDAVVLVSGYGANLSVLGHLFGPRDTVVYDSLAHESIVAGVRFSGAAKSSFPHNDVAALEGILGKARPTTRRLLVVVEGVYSMDGDLARFDEIIAVAKRYDAMVFVDEAHSIGVVGATGRGVGEHFQVGSETVDIWMGTLSKALASCGGYIAGSRDLIEYLKYTLPGFVYSVGISPANAAAALAAVHALRSEPQRVRTVQSRAAYFLDLCRERGLNTGRSQGSAIVPCIVGDAEDCLRLGAALLEREINVQPIIHPAVPEGQSRLRFFVTASHSEEQILRTADALCEELIKIQPAALVDELPSLVGS